MNHILAILTGEGYKSDILLTNDNGKEIVEFLADADIDADGANGQHGAKAAYRIDDSGSEYLANGGMRVSGGKVIGAASWFKDIVILDETGQPKVFPGGIIASKTSYRYPGARVNDPNAYVDSETIPYIVVPPIVITGTRGIVMGCACTATYNGKTIIGVVADAGPRTKNGEVSIAMARALGMNPSPRSGGVDKPAVKYRIFPGEAAQVLGHTFTLQKA